MTKPVIPQGMRDFPADVLRKRHYIFQTIRRLFELAGFEPLETPAMENLETLTGKYGEEGDQLLFKILNNGLDHDSKKESAAAAFSQVLEGKSSPGLTERALRYDLTIPFARYVAMHHNELAIPFRRFQMQPVWRADRPQKGRYREFYQCDADIVGSRSLLNEVELAKLYLDVFAALNLPVVLKINHRGILSGLASVCGGGDRLTAITVAIDKLDKIGWEKVKLELLSRNIEETKVDLIEKYLALAGTNPEKLAGVSELFGRATSSGNIFIQQAVADIEFILKFFPDEPRVVVDLSLARGLSYYTGAIFEVSAQNVKMGSIGGGGRYDDLTGMFGLKNMPGVGISFGVDRIYDVLETLDLFPPETSRFSGALFFNMGEGPATECVNLIEGLRSRHSIRCELYHEPVKFDKQFKYAEKKGYPFVVIIGDEELVSRNAKVKNLQSGVQTEIPFDDLAAAIGF